MSVFANCYIFVGKCSTYVLSKIETEKSIRDAGQMIDSVSDDGDGVGDGIAENSGCVLIAFLGETGELACLGSVRRLHHSKSLVSVRAIFLFNLSGLAVVALGKHNSVRNLRLRSKSRNTAIR